MAYFWFSTLIAKYMHPNVIIFNLQQVYMYIQLLRTLYDFCHHILAYRGTQYLRYFSLERESLFFAFIYSEKNSISQIFRV